MPATSPCGLSAVLENRSSWPVRLLAVVALPPGALPPFLGTMRRSDFSRPFFISPYVPSEYRYQIRLGAEAERSPRVRGTKLRAKPSSLPMLADGYRASLLFTSSPPSHRLIDASLFAQFSTTPQASTRHSLAGGSPFRTCSSCEPGPVLRTNALASLVRGSLRQGPQRILCS